MRPSGGLQASPKGLWILSGAGVGLGPTFWPAVASLAGALHLPRRPSQNCTGPCREEQEGEERPVSPPRRIHLPSLSVPETTQTHRKVRFRPLRPGRSPTRRWPQTSAPSRQLYRPSALWPQGQAELSPLGRTPLTICCDTGAAIGESLAAPVSAKKVPSRMRSAASDSAMAAPGLQDLAFRRPSPEGRAGREPAPSSPPSPGLPEGWAAASSPLPAGVTAP